MRLRSAAPSARGGIAPVAAMISPDGGPEARPLEAGPQAIEKDQLRIGALPEQEVADALLAAGADQEIGVGDVAGQQMPGEHRLVDRRRLKAPPPRLLRDAPRRAGDLGPPAIAQRDRQVQLAV